MKEWNFINRGDDKTALNMPVLITNIIVNRGVASPRSQQKPKQSQKYATPLRKVRNPRENILLWKVIFEVRNWFRSLLRACSLARYDRKVQCSILSCKGTRSEENYLFIVAAVFCSFSSLSQKCISTPAISYHNTTNKNNRAHGTSWIKCLVRNHLPRPTEVCRRLDITQQHELESKAGKIKR